MTVYAPGKTKLLRAISQGVSAPDALAFDGTGNLYVANTVPYHLYGEFDGLYPAQQEGAADDRITG